MLFDRRNRVLACFGSSLALGTHACLERGNFINTPYSEVINTTIHHPELVFKYSVFL